MTENLYPAMLDPAAESGWLIAQGDDASPRRTYFAPAIGRKFGSGQGWGEDLGTALAFARKSDAEEFARTYLPLHVGGYTYHWMKLPDVARPAKK